jgi:hypothetical protein
MIALFLSFIISLSFVGEGPITEAEVNAYDSIIVVTIEGITAHQYEAIQYLVDERDELQIEYGCLWSGVMVFKLYNSPLKERGDVHLYIKSLVNRVSPTPSMEIMHVHTGVAGTAKC